MCMIAQECPPGLRWRSAASDLYLETVESASSTPSFSKSPRIRGERPVCRRMPCLLVQPGPEKIWRVAGFLSAFSKFKDQSPALLLPAHTGAHDPDGFQPSKLIGSVSCQLLHLMEPPGMSWCTGLPTALVRQ